MRAGMSAKSATRPSGLSRPARTGAGRPGGPGGPAGPCSPRGPAGPRSPVGPAGPTAPAGPRSPTAPAGPAAPATPAGPRSPAGPGSPCRPGSPRSPAAPGSPAGPRSPRAPRGPRAPAAGSPATGWVVPVRARVVAVRRLPVVAPRAGRRTALLVVTSPDGVPPFVSGSTRGGVSGRGSVIGCSSGVRSYLDSTSISSTVSGADTSSDPRPPRQLATTRPRPRRFVCVAGSPEGYCRPCRFSGCTAHTTGPSARAPRSGPAGGGGGVRRGDVVGPLPAVEQPSPVPVHLPAADARP